MLIFCCSIAVIAIKVRYYCNVSERCKFCFHPLPISAMFVIVAKCRDAVFGYVACVVDNATG